MDELIAAGGERCQTDQILYNLTRRGPEHDLIPWLRTRHMLVTAYSPVEQGRLLADPGLAGIASDRDATPAQIALAWLLARDGIIAIPKAGSITHMRENRAAADLALSAADLARLDDLFPHPHGPVPLEVL